MSPQHLEFNGIRITIREDIDYLAPRLRYEDKREVLDGYGLNPYQALKISFNTSEISLTIVDKQNFPVGISPIAPVHVAPDVGSPEVTIVPLTET